MDICAPRFVRWNRLGRWLWNVQEIEDVHEFDVLRVGSLCCANTKNNWCDIHLPVKGLPERSQSKKS